MSQYKTSRVETESDRDLLLETPLGSGVRVWNNVDKQLHMGDGETPGGVVVGSGSGASAADIDALKASSPSSSPVTLTAADSEGVYYFTLADYTGQADDKTIVEQDDTPLTEGAWVLQNANAIAHQYPESTKRRVWAETASKRVELSGFTDADPSAATDSYEALQNLIATASARKGEAVIDGRYRIKLNGRPPITIGSNLTVRGARCNTGNDPGLSAGIYFDQDAPESIVVNDAAVTFDRVQVIGASTASTYPGIKAKGLNSALRLMGGTLVQGWQIGVKLENGYYHRMNDAVFADCMTGIQVSAPTTLPPIYNLTLNQVKITARQAAGSTAMTVFGGSVVSAQHCSFESFQGNGIVLNDATLNLFGCYFEGSGGYNLILFNKSRVIAMGNDVYLRTGAGRWISVESGSVTDVSIVSKGNRFIVPVASESITASAYALLNTDPLTFADLSGDNFGNQPGDVGPNFSYVEPSFYAGAGPSALKGQIFIEPPIGTSRAFKPTSTLPLQISPAQTGLGSAPVAPMLLPYAVNGNGAAGTLDGDDPGAWRGTPWTDGGDAMLMVFHRSKAVPNGQWEKVGLRLPFIANPTDAASTQTALASLFTELKKQGVMRPS